PVSWTVLSLYLARAASRPLANSAAMASDVMVTAGFRPTSTKTQGSNADRVASKAVPMTVTLDPLEARSQEALSLRKHRTSAHPGGTTKVKTALPVASAPIVPTSPDSSTRLPLYFAPAAAASLAHSWAYSAAVSLAGGPGSL